MNPGAYGGVMMRISVPKDQVTGGAWRIQHVDGESYNKIEAYYSTTCHRRLATEGLLPKACYLRLNTDITGAPDGVSAPSCPQMHKRPGTLCGCRAVCCTAGFRQHRMRPIPDSRAGPVSGTDGAASTWSWIRSAGFAPALRRRPGRSRPACAVGRQ